MWGGVAAEDVRAAKVGCRVCVWGGRVEVFGNGGRGGGVDMKGVDPLRVRHILGDRDERSRNCRVWV